MQYALFYLVWLAPLQRRRHLKVTPTTATVGKRTCFEFLTTGANGKPRGAVSVQFMNQHRTTDPNGRASACLELPFAGRFSVWAFAKSKSGSTRSTLTAVHAVSHPAGWPQQLRINFIVSCTLTTGGQTSRCGCMADKLSKEIPADQVDSLPPDDPRVQAALKSCWRVIA